jgi:hypothetical protein
MSKLMSYEYSTTYCLPYYMEDNPGLYVQLFKRILDINVLSLDMIYGTQL